MLALAPLLPAGEAVPLARPPRRAPWPRYAAFALGGASAVREGPSDDGFTPPASRPLPLLRARAALRLRNLSPRTEEAYLGWMRRFYEFHGRRDPARLGAEHVTAFLSALATRSRVSASTRSQALAAPFFLYREVLRVDLSWLDELVSAKAPSRLPVVL